jgi:hypothetical protein
MFREPSLIGILSSQFTAEEFDHVYFGCSAASPAATVLLLLLAEMRKFPRVGDTFARREDLTDVVRSFLEQSQSVSMTLV